MVELVSFSLWIAGDVAWAVGMYESRPMGTAVISVTDLFKRRDFRPQPRVPSVLDASYAGLCASLGDLNAELRRRRRAPVRRSAVRRDLRGA
jgi:hypothetical protein